MKDLQVILNGGFIIALFAIGGWLVLVVCAWVLMKFGQLLQSAASVNESLTRLNPYIMAHKKKLIDKGNYDDYIKQAEKDGVAVEDGGFNFPDEDNPYVAPKKIGKKKNKNKGKEE